MTFCGKFCTSSNSRAAWPFSRSRSCGKGTREPCWFRSWPAEERWHLISFSKLIHMITIQGVWVDRFITTSSILQRRKERHSSNKYLTSQACNSRRWQQHREARLRDVPLFLQIYKWGEYCLARSVTRVSCSCLARFAQRTEEKWLLVVYREPLRTR